MDKIAVLIPCYNEAKTVEKVVQDFKRVLPDATIYVYDNNSSDGTDKLAREAGATVCYEYQQGKGNVVRRMFQEIPARIFPPTAYAKTPDPRFLHSAAARVCAGFPVPGKRRRCAQNLRKQPRGVSAKCGRRCAFRFCGNYPNK